MRFLLLLPLLLLCTHFSNAQAPTPRWTSAIRASNGGNTNLRYHTVDKKGNSYLVGNFSGTITIDTMKRTASGQDVYVAKFANNGKIEWVTTFGGTSTQEGIQLSPDDDGNVYVAGSFFSRLSVGDSSYVAGGSYDSYITKLDKDGKITWSIIGTGISQQQSKAVETDGQGNVYWMGDYAGTSTIAGKSMTPSGSTDAYLVKITSKGYVVRTGSYGGSSFDQSFDIATNGTSVYISGIYFNSFSIGTSSVSSSGGYDVFYARFDSTQTLSWLKSAGGFSSDNIRGMGVNSKGELFLTGTFTNSITFGTKTVTGTWGDVYVARIRANANIEFVSVIKGPTTGFSQIYPSGIHGFDDGSVYLGGYHASAININSKTYSPSGTSDIFVIGFSDKGVFRWINRGGNTAGETSHGFSVDSVGYYYVGGTTSAATKFGTHSVAASGFSTNFIAQGTKPIKKPVIRGLGNRFVYVDSTLSRSYMDVTTQAEYTLVKGPTGMTLTQDSARLEFSPTASQIGKHLVRIKAENLAGDDEDSFFVFVIDTLKLSLNLSDYGCQNLPITFEQANKDVGPLNVTWDFGDSTSATTETFDKAYSKIGTFYIKMVATNGLGATDSLMDTITIVAAPRAKFNVLKACTNDTLTLSDSSKAHSGQIVSRQWYENKTLVTGADSLLKIFKSAKASNKYRLVVANTFGCKDSIERTVRISDKPDAGYSAFNACVGDDALFFDESDPNGDTIDYYIWDFGDGVQFKTSAPGAIHKYATGGEYKPSLTVVTINGCSATAIEDVEVYNKPIPNFDVNDICLGEKIAFEDLSTSPDATIQQRRWTTGDGKSFSKKTFNYTYKVPGKYTVALVIANSNGCIDTLEKQLVVAGEIKAGFDYSLPCEFQSVSLRDTSKISILDSLSYRRWYIDGTYTSDFSNISTTLGGASSTIDVSLSLGTKIGCIDSITIPITPLTVATADFGLVDGCDGDTLPITTSVDTSNVTKVEWVGIGVLVTGGIPTWSAVLTHTENAQLFMRTFSKNGCQDSIVRSVKVHPIPSAEFSYSIDSANRLATFTADESGADNYLWDLGLGSTQTTQANTIDQKYDENNPYTVSLTVEANGCTASTEKLIIIDIKSSMGEALINALNVFPNPVQDRLHIQAKNDVRMLRWEVRALTGQSLLSGREAMVETHALTPGVYLLQVETDKGAVQYRFSKVQ